MRRTTRHKENRESFQQDASRREEIPDLGTSVYFKHYRPILVLRHCRRRPRHG